jgi:uncharacterized protein with gpF-like domain
MDLKELLGEELHEQVTAKLGDKELAVINDGSYIPKRKFDELNDDKKELKRQLEERDNQLKELGSQAEGNEALTKQINQLKEENANQATAYEKKLQDQLFDTKLDDALCDAKAKKLKAVKALLDLESIKLDGDKLLGLEDQLKKVIEEDSYLFSVEESPKLGGCNPNPTSAPPSTGMIKE